MVLAGHPLLQPNWRDLIEEAMGEAVDALRSVPGLRGLIVGGSVGRGEPWPLSDIDIVPVYSADTRDAAAAALDRRRSVLVECWGDAGRHRSLDCGWLAFTDAEVRHVTTLPPSAATTLMDDMRWFHGIDKAWHGRSEADPDGVARTLLEWIGRARFDPAVVDRRVGYWRTAAAQARDQAVSELEAGRPKTAGAALQMAAEALMEAFTERWGGRSGSLSRASTRFERFAAQVGKAEVAEAVMEIAGCRTADMEGRLELAPGWLRDRITFAYEARRLAGEEITRKENARDQLVGYGRWYAKHAGPQAWTSREPLSMKNLPGAGSTN
jgi:predicted nucleotidyltransferase